MPITHKTFYEIEEAITRSLQRSKEYGVDPHIKMAPENSRLKTGELSARIESQQAFFDVAKTEINTLYKLLQDTGFCMALADKDGYVLYIIGDAALEEHFRMRHCVPGYRWLEEDMGTCAIGLSIVEKCPIFLPGNRMYATLAKSISNAGAPVFGINKELLGVISLSGYSNLMHIHTLGLVCQAAIAVTSHLREQMRLREIAIKNQYVNALLEAGTKGIVTVDQEGRIVQTNRKACILLELSASCIGEKFTDLLKTDFKLSTLLKSGKGFLLREITSNRGRHFVSLAPVFMDKHDMVGAILTITELKEMVELAMKMTGSNAHFTFQSIIGKSKAILNAIHMAKISAKNSAPVLIYGETGTGKELFAQAIHNASKRHDKPFVAINCGAIPKELLESELFGYEEGAFTGAQKGGKPGKLELADTGTLFLDEIGDMPFDMQVKLLRVLQTGEIRRLGGIRTITIDLRIISATNKDLRHEMSHERFRPDLFYRIITLNILVPPLRERKSDILMLTEYFMLRHGYDPKQNLIAPETMQAILDFNWPGNIRQLESSVERAIYLAQGQKLKSVHFGIAELEEKTEPQKTKLKLRTLEKIEQEAIEETLKACSGNLSQAAKNLGISRPTLYRKMQSYIS